MITGSTHAICAWQTALTDKLDYISLGNKDEAGEVQDTHSSQDPNFGRQHKRLGCLLSSRLPRLYCEQTTKQSASFSSFNVVYHSREQQPLRMLLTSSQISVAVSAGIGRFRMPVGSSPAGSSRYLPNGFQLTKHISVILCTFALFFSGYVLQQRTLRQLRQSIREPKPEPPKIFLPDRFNKMTTELSDGTIVTIENDNYESGIIIADNAPSKSQTSPAAGGHKDIAAAAAAEIVVEVKASLPGADDEQTQQRLTGQGVSSDSVHIEKAAAQQKAADTIAVAAPAGAMKKIGATEKQQKPVSKAERRRLIKQELMQLSHNEKPVHYQRRLY